MPRTTTPLSSGVTTAKRESKILRLVSSEKKKMAAEATAREVREWEANRRLVEKLIQSGSPHAVATC